MVMQLNVSGVPHVGQWGSRPGYRHRGWCIMCRDLKNKELTKSQSVFYYHHVPTILNIASDKILLPEKLFCCSNLKQSAMVTIEF